MAERSDDDGPADVVDFADVDVTVVTAVVIVTAVSEPPDEHAESTSKAAATAANLPNLTMSASALLPALRPSERE